MAKNDLDESLVVKALVNLFDIDDEATATRLVTTGTRGMTSLIRFPMGRRRDGYVRS